MTHEELVKKVAEKINSEAGILVGNYGASAEISDPENVARAVLAVVYAELETVTDEMIAAVEREEELTGYVAAAYEHMGIKDAWSVALAATPLNPKPKERPY